MKKWISLLLVLLMAMGLFAGCSEPVDETSYIVTVKEGGESVTYPVAPYRYYLQWMRDYYYAYVSALTAEMKNPPSWEQLLESTTLTAPDTLSAYLVSCAQDQYMTYLYIEKTFEALGLTLTEEEKAEVDRIIQNDWVAIYGHDRFNSIRQTLGMSYDEFWDLMSCNIKSEKIIQHYYGEGGEKEITEQAMKDHYVNNYARFKYVIFMTKDSDGNKYGDTKMGEVHAKRDAALAELQAGASFEDVLKKYSEDYTDVTGSELTTEQKEAYETQNKTMVEEGLIINDEGVFSETLANYYNITVDEDVVEEVFSMKVGEVETVTIDDSIWIVKRYAVDEEESYFEGVRDLIFKELYAEDLSARHTKWRASLDYSYNQAAIDAYSPANLADLFDFAGTGALGSTTPSGSSTPSGS